MLIKDWVAHSYYSIWIYKTDGIFTDVDTADTLIISQVTAKTLRCLNQQHVSNVSAIHKKTNGNLDYVSHAED